MENKVTTVSGLLEDRSNCRKIKGEYYLKGDYKVENSGDCYFINSKYYKGNTGYHIVSSEAEKNTMIHALHPSLASQN